MDGETYALEYLDIRIGHVTELDSDFPNLWGTFTPLDSDDNPDVRDRNESHSLTSSKATTGILLIHPGRDRPS